MKRGDLIELKDLLSWVPLHSDRNYDILSKKDPRIARGQIALVIESFLGKSGLLLYVITSDGAGWTNSYYFKRVQSIEELI